MEHLSLRAARADSVGHLVPDGRSISIAHGDRAPHHGLSVMLQQVLHARVCAPRARACLRKKNGLVGNRCRAQG